MLFKKKIKASSRGITFSFFNKDSKFDIGQKYLIDIKQNQVVLIADEEGTHKVCNKNGIKSLIDLRAKGVVERFKNAEYLEIIVLENEIIIEGFQGDVRTTEVSKVTNVVHIQNIQKKRIVARAKIKKSDLRLAVGKYVQTTIFDYLEKVENTIESISNQGATEKFVVPFRSLEFPLEIVSLFSGAGIFDFGFKSEGFKIKFACDLDKDACKTYKHNVGPEIVNMDICKLKKSEIPRTRILVGSPPCTAFSNERSNGHLISAKNHKDAPLLQEYIETVKYHRYDIFVIENVPQILTAENGTYLKQVLENLQEYEITYGVLNDAEYGGFQLRKRAFIIGSKIGKIDLPTATHKKSNFKTVWDAIKNITEDMPNQSDVTTPSEIVVERMKHIPQGGNFKNLPEHLKTKAKHSNSYRRLELNEPSITLVNYRKPVIIHPTQNRTLTVREAGALSGLPNDFKFFGTLSSKQQQIGNCVPFRLAKAIASTIKNAVLEFQNGFRMQYA